MSGSFFDNENYDADYHYTYPNRMKKREEFVTLTKKGNRVITKGLVLQFSKTDSQEVDTPKIGYTASKKVGNSVYRNRSKRRLKEATREVHRRNPKLFKANHSYNFIARHSTIDRPFDNLIRDMKFALHNAK